MHYAVLNASIIGQRMRYFLLIDFIFQCTYIIYVFHSNLQCSGFSFLYTFYIMFTKYLELKSSDKIYTVL